MVHSLVIGSRPPMGMRPVGDSRSTWEVVRIMLWSSSMNVPRDTSAFCRVGNTCAVRDSGLRLKGICLRYSLGV